MPRWAIEIKQLRAQYDRVESSSSMFLSLVSR